jgi:hypothetical protein
LSGAGGNHWWNNYLYGGITFLGKVGIHEVYSQGTFANICTMVNIKMGTIKTSADILLLPMATML